MPEVQEVGLATLVSMKRDTKLAIADIGDLAQVAKLSNGNVHLTFGSALDIFGGKGVKLEELIAWNKAHETQ